ncbi:MAG: phosphoenolpyruvate carboxykinase [Anaerolineaceae bacterium]
METTTFQIFDGKVIIRLRSRVCNSPEELLSSEHFTTILTRFVRDLSHQRSPLLKIFSDDEITSQDIQLLVKTLQYLLNLPAELVPRVVDGSDQFFRDLTLLNDFVEQLYNHWRSLHRLMVCDTEADRYDKRPYRTFNETVETLMHVVRRTYRDIQENITGKHPKIYRQVSAGAEVGAIALPRSSQFEERVYQKLNKISVIRQVLIYPPLIFNSTINIRKGMFERVAYNPLLNLEINPREWLCYPAKVGNLLVMVYFTMQDFELGFSLSNLFELAEDEEINRKPDAIFLFGVPPTTSKSEGNETVFYDDADNNMMVATIPHRDEFGYFGYLKKMILTLHNIIMLKRGYLPYHGAMVHITVRNKGSFTILLVGDSGAGKSETLEALRVIGKKDVEDLLIIADDMGSLKQDGEGSILGYGTEMGAFVRLDDLASGYALGQIDRTIIINANQTNARVVLPVTKYQHVVHGYPVDFVFYANNYEKVDESHPAIELCKDSQEALDIFRTGAVMSKGTTSTTGLVNSYFGNIFGPPQYRELHDPLAEKFFKAFFDKGIAVGQMRTSLGIPGSEHSGPEVAAKALLSMLQNARRD